MCLAFVGAMRVYGVPEEVLTDNGKVFTGRFHKPGVPVEVLFDRICRENGITHRLTKVHSPTTTGKIKRLHQTLQDELLDVRGRFAGIEALQAALDAWRPGVQHRPAAPVAGDGLPGQPVQARGFAPGVACPGPARGPDHGAGARTGSAACARSRPCRQQRRARSRGPVMAGRPWRWTGWCPVGEPVDRRPAGLAQPGAGRAAGHPLGG